MASPQIYDHYFSNFDNNDTKQDDFERIVFLHGRCKGDLIKPHLSYKPLLLSILSASKTKYNKRIQIYMPEYHEYIGLECYEPWSLKLGPISRPLHESVLCQIAHWNNVNGIKKIIFITNSWGSVFSMKLLSNKEVVNHIKKVILIAPVFNCWMIEQHQKYILNNLNIQILSIYGSNDMQCFNDSNNGKVKECLLKWFQASILNIIQIEGGTHGGIYDPIQNSKWNGRKWIIGSSQQKYFDLFGNENNSYIEKKSKYQEPKLPKCMNTKQYRDKIAKYASLFIFDDKNNKSMFVKLENNHNFGLKAALIILNCLIKAFTIRNQKTIVFEKMHLIIIIYFVYFNASYTFFFNL